jgi:hypothetical protein
VAVSLFGAACPHDFATFDLAFFTLLFVTAGEPWPHTLHRVHEDGTADWNVLAFCGCYLIVTTWLVLQAGSAPYISFSAPLASLLPVIRRVRLQSRYTCIRSAGGIRTLNGRLT